MKMKSLSAFRITALCFAMAVSANAQAFTKADSGWVRIFNGVDFTGLYSRLYAAAVVHPVDTSAFSIVYPGTDSACLRVKTTSKRGEVGTDRADYTHYRTRMEYRFDVATANYNAGLLYGVDETKIRMQNNWPRGFEFQMQQSEPGSVYSIQQVTATTRATGGAYSPTGTVVQVCEYGCNARSYRGNPVIPSAVGTTTKWMRIELIQRGSDSAIHIVNDTVVMKIWNIRIFNDSTKKTGGTTTSGGATNSNLTPNGPYPSGALAVEGEGALINHRRWEVMEFPASTPMTENFLHRLVLTNRQPIRPAVNTPVTILWRSIGTIPKVKLQYKMGAGAWLPITDSTTNSGTFSWTSPATITDSLRFRISSYDYVIPDSTGTFSTTGIHPGSKTFSRFTLNNHGLTLLDIAAFKEAGITDVFGREVRVMPVNGNDFHWDFTDAKGTRVTKGLYFVRLKGNGFSQTFRVPVF